VSRQFYYKSCATTTKLKDHWQTRQAGLSLSLCAFPLSTACHQPEAERPIRCSGHLSRPSSMPRPMMPNTACPLSHVSRKLPHQVVHTFHELGLIDPVVGGTLILCTLCLSWACHCSPHHPLCALTKYSTLALDAGNDLNVTSRVHKHWAKCLNWHA
jgi:hypothetical protein